MHAAVTKSALVPARSTSAVLAQLSRRHGSSENGAVAANAVLTNAARRAACRPWPDDVADDQQGGLLRPLGHEIEVAADLLGGGHERRGQLQAGALGQLRRGERVADRAQVLELVLGHREAPSQLRELVVAHLRLPAQALDQRVLAVLVLAHVADVVLAGIRLGVQSQ